MRIAFLCLILFPFIALGQNLEISVIASESGEALPFANIYMKKSGIGASTDIHGKANFEQSQILPLDTLIVSYIGYDSRIIPYRKSKDGLQLNIQMISSSHILSEAVVKYEKPLKPEKIIKSAIKNTESNYSTKEVILNTIYRQTIQEDEQFIQLDEAFVNVYFSAYPQKSLDSKIWQDWFYDDSYAFDLEGNRYFHPLLKDFNTETDQQSVIASRKSENWSKHGMETVIIGEPVLLLAFDKIKYQYDFLNPQVLNKYHFKNEGLEFVNGENCYVISFYPKDTKARFRIDQSKKNKSAIYIGRMYVSTSSFALVKFQYKLAVYRDFGFFARRIPLDYQVEFNYKKRNEVWHVDNILFSETKKVGTQASGDAILHTAKQELYVLDVNDSDVSAIPDSARFKSTRFSSIRHYDKNYNPSYWDDAKIPEELIISGKVKTDLEFSKSLEEQYHAFTNEAKKDLPVPRAPKYPYSFHYHNVSFVDSLHWMALPSHEEEFMQYLNQENQYARNSLLEDKKYQRKLFDELNTFYSVEGGKGKSPAVGSYFYDLDSLDHDILYFQKDSTEKVEVVDVTVFRDAHPSTYINKFLPNPSRDLMLVQYQKPGMMGNFCSILSFGQNEYLAELSHVYSIAWNSDSSLIYAKTNSLGRADSLFYFPLNSKLDSLMYAEKDVRYDLEVLRDNDQIFCTVQSKTENEIYRVISKNDRPKMSLMRMRKDGVLNTLKSADGLYILVNDESSGDKIERLDVLESSFSPMLAGKNIHLESFCVTRDFVAAQVYDHSIPELHYFHKEDRKWKTIETKLGIGRYRLQSNSDSSNVLHFSFSSASVPSSSYSYDFESEELKKISSQPVKNENFSRFTSVERLWAKSYDGVKVPITLVQSRIPLKEHKGLILKAYGAYGSNTTPSFDAQDAILLEHGYTIAYAHVRGESILGRDWYRDGRELNKKNSIADYLACAEFLIKKGKTTANELVGYGNSAGGIIVGQAANEHPELFNTIIFDHAYLDVINTMMNDSLALTTDEYKEWGNPNDEAVFDYISSYSPYQNIKHQVYPNMIFIGSYLDYQTPMWQIAKHVAKLRENNLGNSEILLLTDMNSGHMGSTTGKEWVKLYAEIYSLVKMNLGLTD